MPEFRIFALCSLLLLLSCSEKEPPNIDFSRIDPKKEIATDVELIYSDSAKTKFRILSPRRESYTEDKKFVEEYPLGLYIEFFGPDKNIISSIQSNYARRVSEDGLMTLRDSVVLINNYGDKLTTTGIIWDELNHTLRTSKFVQLVDMSAQDTLYGFGLNAKDDFSEFSIIQLTGKRKYQNLTKEFKENED